MRTISEAAFLSRVRRALARDGERLMISRREYLNPNEYRYVAVDNCNCLSAGWDSIGDMLQHWAIPAGLLSSSEVVAGWEHVTASQAAA
jgi:hypothetical protein